MKRLYKAVLHRDLKRDQNEQNWLISKGSESEWKPLHLDCKTFQAEKHRNELDSSMSRAESGYSVQLRNAMWVTWTEQTALKKIVSKGLAEARQLLPLSV